MKKVIFYAGMLLLIVFAILIDNLRIILNEYSGRAYDLLPALWFDILSTIVFITFIGALTYLVFQFQTPIVVAIIYTLLGLLLASLFLFNLAGISFPQSFNSIIGPIGNYTRLSGAFWLFVGVFNIVKYFKPRVGRANKVDKYI